MKYLKYFSIILSFSVFSCKSIIEITPESNLNTVTYFKNVDEVRAGLVGCYNGMQNPMYHEWQLTELRTDNSKQGNPGSGSAPNRDLSDLDEFIPATIHSAVYNYWLNTYSNIRNCNIVLEKLGVTFDPASNAISLSKPNFVISDSLQKQLAGEAQFIRAYHYFNLVRLYGGVFLIHKSLSAADAKLINRSSADDINKFIEADLKMAVANLSAVKIGKIATADIGKAHAWAAKALLGKFYLTQNRKADAITLFQDVITNSGSALQANYADVFSITNEMNNEIIFTVRFKAGGLGLGSSFGNDFGPLSSGNSVINGSGLGLNAPTFDMDSTMILNKDSVRRAATIATFGTGAAARPYVKKYLNQVAIANDGESDWPIIRYSDVLLMMAEAKGYTPESVALINQVRTRAKMPTLTTQINSVATFELALSNERRFELAFENNRFFDLVRYGTTMTTINALDVIKNHFASEYKLHYALYPSPVLTLAQLQASVTAQRLLLPIPQHEIDTNTGLSIPQNPGY